MNSLRPSIRKSGRMGRSKTVNREDLARIPEGVEEINTRVELIQMLIPLGLMHVNDLLQQEVETLAGKKYGRKVDGQVRWGSQPGSVYLGDQKLSIQVPRVRHCKRKEEIRLGSYERLQRPRNQDEGVLRRILAGLSCRNYEQCAEAVPEAFGLSASTISRRYIRATSRKLKDLMERTLEEYDLVALFLDGKTFAEDSMVLAVGVTVEGRKVMLGMVQTATENEKACSEF